MYRALVVLCLTLLWALPASAAWNDCGTPSITAAVGDVVTPKSRIICHDTAIDTATDSTMLDVKACDHFDVTFDPSATSTAHVADMQLYRCTVNSIAAAWCEKMLVDTDADGIPNDVTIDGYTVGRRGQQGQTAVWIYVDMITAPTGTTLSRTMVTCY